MVLAVLALLPAAVGWYATHVEPYALRVDRATLTDPALVEGGRVRIGVLSDLQTESVGGYERRAVAELVAQEPDIVLVPGDLFQADDEAFEANRQALVELLASIDAPGGVYLVEGDTDGGPVKGRLRSLAEASGAVYLHDELATVIVADRRITIAGAHLQPFFRKDRLSPQLAAIQDGSFRILLAHRPDWALKVPPGGADLVVAGHTHGGQVQVPWFGPLLTHSDVPRQVASGGLHEVGGVPVYVSTGVGHEQQGAPQVRFLAPPSIGIVDLVPGP